MRKPLTYKQISLAIGVSESKASQAMQPAISKIAACMILFPGETIAELDTAMTTLKRQWAIDGEWNQRLDQATAMRADTRTIQIRM